jgi:hypothetical protein
MLALIVAFCRRIFGRIKSLGLARRMGVRLDPDPKAERF